MKLPIDTIRVIRKYIHKEFDPVQVQRTSQDWETSTKVAQIIYTSRGYKHIHDSGFPFIQLIGVHWSRPKTCKGRPVPTFYNMGETDSINIRVKMSIDSIGLNVFRIWCSDLDDMLSNTIEVMGEAHGGTYTIGYAPNSKKRIQAL